MDGSTLEWNFSGIFGAKDRRPFTKFLNQILLFRSLEIKKKNIFLPFDRSKQKEKPKNQAQQLQGHFLSKTFIYTNDYILESMQVPFLSILKTKLKNH